MLYELRTVKEQSTVAHFDENEVPALCSMDLFGFASSMWLQCTSSGCVSIPASRLAFAIRHAVQSLHCKQMRNQTHSNSSTNRLFVNMERIKLFIDICSISGKLSLIKTIASDCLEIEKSVFNRQNLIYRIAALRSSKLRF